MEQAIFTNMCMVSDGNGRVLVQERKNVAWSGIAFPGGHVEEGESFTGSVIREVREETGYTVENPVLCGVKQFPTDSGARYVVFLYRADKFHGNLRSSDEGEVFWIERDRLSEYDLAKDMETMLDIFENDSLSEFYYCKEGDSREYILL